MKKGPGYELWFGKFRGKTVEQLMFHPDGREYFYYILKNFTDKKFNRLREKIKETMKKGETAKPIVNCALCQKQAEYFSVRGANYNIGPEYIYCNSCAKDISELTPELTTVLPLRFSSVSCFADSRSRRDFVKLLKYCFFKKSDLLLTKKRAFQFFEELT